MAQVLIVCSLLNFAARIKLFASSTSIGNLSFWSALSIPRFDTTPFCYVDAGSWYRSRSAVDWITYAIAFNGLQG